MPISLSGVDEFVQSRDGSTAAPAPAGTARTRFNLSTRSWQSSVDGGPWIDLSTAASTYEFVYRPSEPAPSDNVYASWAALVAAAAATRGLKVVYFDDSLAPCSIPAGAWDFGSPARLIGPSSRVQPTLVVVDDGATLANVVEFSGITLRSMSTSYVIDVPGGATWIFILDNDCLVQQLGVGGSVFRCDGATGLFVVAMRAGGRFLTTGEMVVRSNGTHSVQLITFDAAFVGQNTIESPTNNVSGEVYDPGSFVAAAQSVPGGLIPVSLQALAERVSYDDGRAAPGLGATEVQGAIDALKSGAAPTSSVWHEMVLQSVAGRNNYTIPVGNWFLAAASDCSLEIDSGAGWVVQAYGADFSALTRAAGSNPPATVLDAALGFSLSGGPVPAGWSLRFRWLERRLLTKPIALAKVLQPANYAVRWNQNGAVDFPNAVLVPEYPGAQVEFWRQTWRNGGARGTFGVLRREGKRYLPFYRGPIGQFLFPRSEFCPSQGLKRNHFRVCYYVGGARSDLSDDVIVVCSTMQPDRVNGRVARTVGGVWIE